MFIVIVIIADVCLFGSWWMGLRATGDGPQPDSLSTLHVPPTTNSFRSSSSFGSHLGRVQIDFSRLIFHIHLGAHETRAFLDNNFHLCKINVTNNAQAVT